MFGVGIRIKNFAPDMDAIRICFESEHDGSECEVCIERDESGVVFVSIKDLDAEERMVLGQEGSTLIP